MNIYNYISDFIKEYFSSIVWIVFLFAFGKAILVFLVRRIIKLVDDGNDENESEKEKKAKTLGHIIISIGNVVIYIIVLLMFLSMMGIDITPILAGLGIGGLAIGFGAQSLVKDFVSGIFILLESQYDLGDKVKIGIFEGKIKKITLRSTVLRDDKGAYYYISNGSIANVINYSKKNAKKK